MASGRCGIGSVESKVQCVLVIRKRYKDGEGRGGLL